MIFNKRKNIYWFWLIILLFAGFSANAQIINVDANKLLVRSEVSLSPRSGSFVEGSTFQVPIFLNTKGRSINGIEVRIIFSALLVISELYLMALSPKLA